MLLDAYYSILKAAGLDAKGNTPVAQQEGEIYINRGVNEVTEKPLLLVGGKKLVLPVEYQLKNPLDVTWTTRILFHPFVEPALRGADDPVFLAYKEQLEMHANMCIMMQIYSLFAIAADKTTHDNLNPEQAVIVSKLSGINEKTIKSFTNKIQNSLHVGKGVPYVRFYIKNTALLNNEKFSRGCIVSFPVYEELVKDTKNEIITNAEKKIILEVFKYIFSNIDDVNFYSQGSSCKIAPTIVALLLGYGNIAIELNRITNMYKDINTFECPEIPIEYDQYINSLSDSVMLTEIRMIPHHASIQSYKETVATPAPNMQYQNPQFNINQNNQNVNGNNQYSLSDPRRYMTGGNGMNQNNNPNNWSQFQTQSNMPSWANAGNNSNSFGNAFSSNNGFQNNNHTPSNSIYGN